MTDAVKAGHLSIWLEGVKLRDLSERRGVPLGETLCEVLLEQDLKVGYVAEPPTNSAVWRQLDQDYMELLARPDYMVCSDITPAGRFPHPRCYGAFPRFLGRLRREFGTLSLEAMVHRMTDRPARRFGLRGRGRIEKSYFADIAIFHRDRINDNATYESPRQFPTGIPYVIVNGEIAAGRDFGDETVVPIDDKDVSIRCNRQAQWVVQTPSAAEHAPWSGGPCSSERLGNDHHPIIQTVCDIENGLILTCVRLALVLSVTANRGQSQPRRSDHQGSRIRAFGETRANHGQGFKERHLAFRNAEIDPDHKINIDRNNFNNSRTAEPNGKPAAKVSNYWLFVTQWISQALAWWAV